MNVGRNEVAVTPRNSQLSCRKTGGIAATSLNKDVL